jgi:glycosyltransferase involved in cell wall biosynthesis
MTNAAVVFNGTLGAGGLGWGMAQVAWAFARAGMLQRVLCGGIDDGIGLGPLPLTRVSTTALVRALFRTPLRFRHDLIRTLSDASFDLLASRRLPTDLDVVYVCSWAALRTIRTARARGVRAVLWCPTPHIEESIRIAREEGARFGARARYATEWTRRRVLQEYAEADLIRVDSRYVFESMVRCGVPSEKLLLAPPGVDTSRFPPGQGDGVFRVCLVGQLSLLKGYPYLVRAFEELALPDSELVLFGPLVDRFNKRMVVQYLANPRIRHGYGDPVPVYRRASVFVLPSVADGFGFAVLEAMASGLPVIVSESTGAKDWVRDGEEGFVVPDRDVEAIRVRLHELYRDPERARRMGRAARRRAQQLDVGNVGPNLLQALTGRGGAVG